MGNTLLRVRTDREADAVPALLSPHNYNMMAPRNPAPDKPICDSLHPGLASLAVGCRSAEMGGWRGAGGKVSL